MWRIFYYYNHNDVTWFRIFGFGLSWKDKRKSKIILFSERLRINCWHSKNFVFRLLTPKGYLYKR